MRARTLVAAAVLTAMSTAAMAETHSDFNRNFNLGSLNTFEFKAQRRVSNDPVANNQIWADQIRDAIRADLTSHGITENAGGTPDFFVAFYVGLKDRYDVRYLDYGFPYFHRGFRGAWGWPRGYDAWAVPYTESTLIVDVIDARTNELVWRGYDKDSINLGKTEKDFGKAVDAVLKKFYKDRRQSES
jgi:hypothetical protein